MKLTSESFADRGAIPGRCAFAVPDPGSQIRLSDNRNPQLAWSGLPARAKSLVLLCHDRDVPSRGDDVNKDDRQIPATLRRVDFYHWVLVDLDPGGKLLREGEFSNGVTPRGKSGADAPRGARHGINDYTHWFASDKDMAGEYFGYDGPCPPWNDSIVHRYVFTLYALGAAKCPLQGTFTGPKVLAAIGNDILDSARVTGLYALNPAVTF